MAEKLDPTLPDPNAVWVPIPEPVPDPNSTPSTAVKEGVLVGTGAGPLDLALAPGEWSRRQAAQIVRADFDRASAYRQTNHESRWQEAAELYLAYAPGSPMWEGTKTRRANMQVHLIFQVIESLLPQVVDALTGNDLDFDVEAARAGTTITQCHLVRDVVNYALRSLGGNHTRFLGWREVIRRMVKDGLIFGNGVNEWGWEGPYQVEEKKWEMGNFPVYAPHPLAPWIQHPTGEVVQQAVPTVRQRTVSQFWIDPCSLVDFYIDPNTRGPNVQEAEFAIRRKMMTLEELAGYRGQEGWDIPDDLTLLRLARAKQWTQGDTTRSTMAAARGENIQPQDDHSMNPRIAKIEVLRYFSRSHHVWLLSREHVAWNGPNQYGALPFSNWTYVDVPGAFYGQSIPDIVRTDQKLAKALIDGRLDEIALILHPPIVSKRGTFRTQSQSKFAPGRHWEADEPQKDIIRLEMGNVTADSQVEILSLENRVQKVTGVTDIAFTGTPTSGGNSANRSATGVTAQVNASNSRVHYLVANMEDQTIGPLLEVCWQLTREFMDPQTLMEIVGPNGQTLQVNPVDLLNSDPRFVMKTAQRMKQRAALQSGGMNLLLQYFLNPEIGTLTEEQQGKILDIEQLSELYCDTFNLRAMNFFRPMTPQEQQASQQRAQKDGMEKMQLQGARLQQLSADAHERDETTIQVAFLGALAKAGLLNMALGQPTEWGLREKELQASVESSAGE